MKRKITNLVENTSECAMIDNYIPICRNVAELIEYFDNIGCSIASNVFKDEFISVFTVDIITLEWSDKICGLFSDCQYCFTC